MSEWRTIDGERKRKSEITKEEQITRKQEAADRAMMKKTKRRNQVEHDTSYLPYALPCPIVPHPNAGQCTLFLAVEPLDHAMYETKCHFIIFQSNETHARWIDDLQLRMIDFPRWIFGQECGIVRAERIDGPTEIDFKFFLVVYYYGQWGAGVGLR